MQTRTYKVYRFKELTEEAKEKAITKWYEIEDYPFLQDDLTESCKALLEENKISYNDDLKLYYSLGYSQGDGICFIGNFEYKNRQFKVTHESRYYHKYSTDIEIYNKKTDDWEWLNDKMNKKYTGIKGGFINKYLDICRKLEKEGYGILEYRMDNEEFEELCESNDYFFTADGNID